MCAKATLTKYVLTSKKDLESSIISQAKFITYDEGNLLNWKYEEKTRAKIFLCEFCLFPWTFFCIVHKKKKKKVLFPSKMQHTTFCVIIFYGGAHCYCNKTSHCKIFILNFHKMVGAMTVLIILMWTKQKKNLSKWQKCCCYLKKKVTKRQRMTKKINFVKLYVIAAELFSTHWGQLSVHKHAKYVGKNISCPSAKNEEEINTTQIFFVFPKA